MNSVPTPAGLLTAKRRLCRVRGTGRVLPSTECFKAECVDCNESDDHNPRVCNSNAQLFRFLPLLITILLAVLLVVHETIARSPFPTRPTQVRGILHSALLPASVASRLRLFRSTSIPTFHDASSRPLLVTVRVTVLRLRIPRDHARHEPTTRRSLRWRWATPRTPLPWICTTESTRCTPPRSRSPAC